MHDQSAHAPTLATPGGDWYGEPHHRLPTLYSPRLRLRWIDNDDLGALYRMFSDRDALRWWSHPPLATAEDASIYLEEVQRGHRQGDLLQWGFERLDTHGIIGTVLLAGIDAQHGRAELRLLLKSQFWGHGYGREAATALLNHAFHDLGLRRVEAEAAPGNRPSLKSLEAVGFKREGYLRQRWIIRGETQDSILLALLASEFAPAG